MSEAQAIIDHALVHHEPVPVDPGSVYLVPISGGWKTVDLTGDEWSDQPRRKKGKVQVRDAESFLGYWRKHNVAAVSEVFADVDRRTVVAVLDAHGPTAAGWSQHQLVLALRHTPQWKAWADISGRMMEQTVFAEFIEDNRAAIIDPPAADVLELAESFQASTKGEFKSGVRLQSGERQLVWTETTDAQAGRGDKKIPIPDAITLALPVFDGDAEAERVTARLRYRINGGRLSLGIVLDEAEDKVRAAFDAILVAIADGVAPVQVLRGVPVGGI